MHELTHVPFRSWCEHCVRGRGEGVRHEAGKEMPEQTEVHMDFFFVGDEDQNEKLAVLAARERTTRMTMSTVAPSKGKRQFLARRVQAFLREIGADTGDITLKSDQEPAMKALLSKVSGLKTPTLRFQNGDMQSLRFSVMDVLHKPLVAASKIVAAGNRIVMQSASRGSVVEVLGTKRRKRIFKRSGACVLPCWVFRQTSQKRLAPLDELCPKDRQGYP